MTRGGRNKAIADGRGKDDFSTAGAIAEKHAGVSLMK
jgi:hypothetical protein